MRKIAKFLIGFVSVFLISAIIYLYFPQIWGEAVYPLAYQEHIIKYSEQFDVSPSLVAAVIYQESRFNPQAVSRVGARGLMQIMPPTGKGIASSLGEGDSFSPDKLFEPETNIKYGTWYLRDLANRYNNDVQAALAGYNGGPAVANRYVQTREAGNLETSSYIVKVARAEEVYRAAYPKELGLPLPPREVQLRIREQPKSVWQRVKEGWYGLSR